MAPSRSLWLCSLLLTASLPTFAATKGPAYGPELQGFAYPYPVQHFAFESQGKSLQMGYMDVPASGNANGRSVVLMHGKNFCGATWDSSIKTLSKAKIGNYHVLGKQAAKLIPQSTLAEFHGRGHAPQMEEPAQFHQALIGWFNTPLTR